MRTVTLAIDTPQTMSNDFEIFCSYAHADNDDGWVEHFTDSVAKLTRKLAGVEVSIFVDRESLITADIWEKKILKSLESCTLLIAVISPSYVTSEWCRREWAAFEERENIMRERVQLGTEQGLIFPILLYPLNRGRFDESGCAFAERVKMRQWSDLSSQLDGTPIRQHQVRQIAEQLIDSIADLARKTRQLKLPKLVSPSVQTIRDSTTGLEWSASLSNEEMSFDEAVNHAKHFAVDGWRLPTMSELKSILDIDSIVEDPEASPYPLREPFNSQRFGYLHSGTTIRGSGHYIMNVRNGHLFNGKGYAGYVRLVRAMPNEMLLQSTTGNVPV